jgi:hypothetical protein
MISSEVIFVGVDSVIVPLVLDSALDARVLSFTLGTAIKARTVDGEGGREAGGGGRRNAAVKLIRPLC